MSIHVISRVLRKRWGSPSRKIVAVKLADVANEDGTSIYPSVQTVAGEAELSEREVQRILREFRQAGLLIVVRPGGGRRRPTEYRFDLSAINKLPDIKPSAEGSEPQTEIPSMEKGAVVSSFNTETVTSATGNGDTHVTQPVLTRPNFPYGEADASRTGGANAPSLGSQIWTEAMQLLSQCPLSDSRKRSLIGKWQKRTPTGSAKKDLLAAVRAAERAGTPDPVSYIEGALRKHPTPPGPETFTAADWRFKIQAAIKTKQWPPDWGPAPGKRGCRVPPELITRQLQSALSQGMRA